MQARLILGVDGGQSKTLTVLATDRGTILGTGVSGPCNHIHEPGGLERQYQALRLGCERAFAAAGLPFGKLDSVYLGLTGSGSWETVREVYETDHLVMKGDTITALAGAFPSMAGTIIIAGTGAIAYGQNAAGKTGMAGGMGYYLGDEGSGADIAQRAFRAIYQANDGRATRTMLTRLILDHYKCADLKQLHRAIYSGTLSRDQLAQASGKVGEAAQQGDLVAIEILREAGVELGRTISAVLAQIEQIDVPAPIAPIGGVFKAGALVTTPVMEQVCAFNPRAYLATPRFGPAIGAVLLGLRELGITIDDTVIANLEQTKYHLDSPNRG
jgi:N-acetylglucosamine kinase-like BadF-type ATPase